MLLVTTGNAHGASFLSMFFGKGETPPPAATQENKQSVSEETLLPHTKQEIPQHTSSMPSPPASPSLLQSLPSPAIPIPDSPFTGRLRASLKKVITAYEFCEIDRTYDQSKERHLITCILEGDVEGVTRLLGRNANPFDLILMRINGISQKHCAYTIASTVYQGEASKKILSILTRWIHDNIGIVKNSIFDTMYDSDLILFEGLIRALAITYFDYYSYTDYFGNITQRLAKAKFEQMSSAQLLEAAEEIRVLSAESPVLFSPLTKKVQELKSRSLTRIDSYSDLP